MKKALYDMVYLCACAVNGIAADEKRCAEMDEEKLFTVCERHSLTATCAEAYTYASAKWREAKNKSLRKTILFDAERAKILRFMEENRIWYMPLKGVVMKDMYPKMGMRQMADNDILHDAEYAEKIRDFMEANGYTVKYFGHGNHDVYEKEPIFNFEMHTALFSEVKKEFFDYYENVREKLLPTEVTEYGYHFSDEDCYIYITAHEYKHFTGSGTGLRSLLDRYVYLSRKQNTLDMEYIERECEKTGIAAYEKETRSLCMKVFSGKEMPELSEIETELLNAFLYSSTYGTLSNVIRKMLGSTDKKSKQKYLFRRLFPEVEFYKAYCPTAYKYKVLIPFVWVYRVGKALTVSRKRVEKEIKAVKKIK